MCSCKQNMQDVRMKLYADILLLNLSRGGTLSLGEDIAKKVISSFDKEFSITTSVEVQPQPQSDRP